MFNFTIVVFDGTSPTFHDHDTSSQTFSRTISYPSSFYSHLPAYEDGTDSVPKRRHINSRRRIITQKKAYNITFFRLRNRQKIVLIRFENIRHITPTACEDSLFWNKTQ